MKSATPKSTRSTRDVKNFYTYLPQSPYSIASIVYSWLAAERSDTPNYTTGVLSPAEQAFRVEEEIAELERNHNYNDAMHYRCLAELRAEQVRLEQQRNRPRFTADVERQMRRNTTTNNPYSPNIRGPRPLGRNRHSARQGSAMDIDTSFRREPSMMDVDGASFSRPRPQPQPKRRTPAPCPSIIMEDSSFCIRDRKVRRGGSIRVESVLLDPAAIAQAAREKEEADRIAAMRAKRMTEDFQQRVAAEQQLRAAAMAARAEAKRQAEAAAAAAEAARIAEEAREAAETEHARQEAQRQADALRAAEAQRRVEEERASAAKNGFLTRLEQESAAIKSEPDAVLRAFKMYEWKMQLIKTQSTELIEAGIKLDITHLPWPMFEPSAAQTVLHLSGGEPELAIREFVLHKQHPEAKGATKKVLLREVARWHPDKMAPVILSAVKADQVKECENLINFTSAYLNNMFNQA